MARTAAKERSVSGNLSKVHWLSHAPAGSACDLLADAALCGRVRTATSLTFASA